MLLETSTYIYTDNSTVYYRSTHILGRSPAVHPAVDEHECTKVSLISCLFVVQLMRLIRLVMVGHGPTTMNE